VASFAAQIAAIAAGERPPTLAVGDLSVERDFSDVRDVISAYFTLFERGDRGAVYNVCSGVGLRLDYVLAQLVLAAATEVRIDVDQARLRISETPRLVGDNRKLRSLGWRPQIPLSQTLKDVFEHAFNARAHMNP
jgi:GDP-4-dehydro-6-deoxy-D-mannose reductase